MAIITELIEEGAKDEPIHRLSRTTIIGGKRGNRWIIPEKDWEAEVNAVWNWIRTNIRYTLDPYPHDTYQRARRTLELRAGDCDDLVIFAGAVLHNLGYPIKIITIDTTGDWNHIYLQAGIPPQDPDEWVAFDAAATEENKLGYEYPDTIVRRRKVFNQLSGGGGLAGVTFDWWQAVAAGVALMFLGKYWR